jgi:hypothetical protein
MSLKKQNIILAIFLLLSAACNNSILFYPGSIVGSYRLKYYAKIDNGTGWDYDQDHREELMKINPDLSYTIERIYPQGGFEILPDSGTWKIQNNLLLLNSNNLDNVRSFEFAKNGIIEPKCAREDLSNILWHSE